MSPGPWSVRNFAGDIHPPDWNVEANNGALRWCAAHLATEAEAIAIRDALNGVVRAAPREPSPDFAELITAARFALKECEEITSCYPNAGDFWGLANNAAEELRRALAGEAVSAFAKAVIAPQPPVDMERLNRAVDTMMEQAENLRKVLASRGVWGERAAGEGT